MSGSNEITEDFVDLYENAPCGYLSVQSDSRIFKVNQTFCRWTGFAAEELVGQRLHDLLNIAGRIFYETHFAPMLRMQGSFNEVALEFVGKDGQRIPALVNASEKRHPNGEILSIRLTVFNATDRRRYERDLVEARSRAEEAGRELRALNAALEARASLAVSEAAEITTALEQLKAIELEMRETLKSEREEALLREQFIAVLGHDLRNPLAAIHAGSRLLQRQPLNEKSVGILTMMQASLQRMYGLIDNVLDFARGRLGGGMTLNRSVDIPLEITLTEVVEEFRSIEPDRQIQSTYVLEAAVNCDHSRIAQLVSNLVGNALTHGSADSAVQVEAHSNEDELVISVTNKGDPIPDELQEKLFHPFFRGESRASKQGLGLGLHIAAEIARAHGGTLVAMSTPEQTRFTFRMPAKF